MFLLLIHLLLSFVSPGDCENGISLLLASRCSRLGEVVNFLPCSQVFLRGTIVIHLENWLLVADKI